MNEITNFSQHLKGLNMKLSRIASISAVVTLAALGSAAYAGGGDVNYPSNVAQPAAAQSVQLSGDFDGRLYSESGTVDTVIASKKAPAANVASNEAQVFVSQDLHVLYTRG
jgi:hypothetical protein